MKRAWLKAVRYFGWKLPPEAPTDENEIPPEKRVLGFTAFDWPKWPVIRETDGRKPQGRLYKARERSSE